MTRVPPSRASTRLRPASETQHGSVHPLTATQQTSRRPINPNRSATRRYLAPAIPEPSLCGKTHIWLSGIRIGRDSQTFLNGMFYVNPDRSFDFKSSAVFDTRIDASATPIHPSLGTGRCTPDGDVQYFPTIWTEQQVRVDRERRERVAAISLQDQINDWQSRLDDTRQEDGLVREEDERTVGGVHNTIKEEGRDKEIKVEKDD